MKPLSLALQAYPDALLDMDQHPVAIDVADLEVADLGRPEHGTIGNAERGAILKPWTGWCRASSPKAAQQPTRALLGQIVKTARSHRELASSFADSVVLRHEQDPAAPSIKANLTDVCQTMARRHARRTSPS